MNRVEFMAELERLLADLPEDERQAAVQYYADYFADAGAENEAEVIRELGSPEKTAESIKADYYGRTFDESRFEHKDPAHIFAAESLRRKGHLYLISGHNGIMDDSRGIVLRVDPVDGISDH